MGSGSARVGVAGIARNGPVPWHALAEFFLLRSAEQAAKARPPALIQRTRAQLEHAVRTMRAAEQAESVELRVELARQAVRELRECTVYETGSAPDTSAGPGTQAAPDDDPSSLWGHLSRARPLAQILARLPGLDSTPIGEKREYENLERLFAWLETRNVALTVREVRVSRWLRCSSLGVVLASLVFFGLTPKNLALGKPVKASTTCGGTPAAALGKEPLHRVVDGRRREQAFAVCTEVEAKPWVQVDLGRPHRIDRVVAYPRTDCCYGEQELPVSVELSNDGQHFEIVATRSTPATTNFPWRFTIEGRGARYVRLSTDSKEPRHVVLGELEVYGR